MRGTLVVVFAFCAIVGLSAFRSGRPKPNVSTKQADITVRSLLPKLEIAEVTPVSRDTVRFVMRNGYEKDITAVVTSNGPGRFIRRDYICAELDKYQKLASGASDDFLYGVDTPESGGEIVISSVLFSDMTVEGQDMREIRGILDTRRGLKTQLARVNPRIQKLAGANRPLILNELQGLRQLAEGLPIQMDDGSPLSDDLEHGLREGRELILRRLGRLETQLRKVETYYTRDRQRVTGTEDEEISRQKARDTVAMFKSLEQRL